MNMHLYDDKVAEAIANGGRIYIEEMKKDIKLSRLIDDIDMNKPIVHVDYDYASLYPWENNELAKNGNTAL